MVKNNFTQRVKINIDEILFIKGMKEYIKVVTPEKTYITHKSLSSLTEELPEERFIRIHKSFTIALDKVKLLKEIEYKLLLTHYQLEEIIVKK